MTKGRYLLEIKYFSDAFFDVCGQFKDIKDGEAFIYNRYIGSTDYYLSRNSKCFTVRKIGSDRIYRRLLDGHYDHAYTDLLKAFIDALEEDEEHVDV